MGVLCPQVQLSVIVGNHLVAFLQKVFKEYPYSTPCHTPQSQSTPEDTSPEPICHILYCPFSLPKSMYFA